MNVRAVLLFLGLGLLAAALWYDAKAVEAFRQRREAARKAEATAARITRELRGLGGGVETDSSLSKSAKPAKPAPLAGGGSKDSGSLALKPISWRAILARDPGFTARYLDAYRASIDAHFGLLFRRLGLAPADESHLRDLLADLEAQRLKVAQIASDQGLDMYDPSMDPLRKEILGPDKAAIQQMLTPAQWQSYQQYQQESGLVYTIQKLVGNPFAGNITPDQAMALLPVLTNASQRDSDGEVVDHSVNVQTAVAGASHILSPDQLTVLAAFLKKDEADRALWKANSGP